MPVPQPRRSITDTVSLLAALTGEGRSQSLPIRADYGLVVDDDDRTAQERRLLDHQVDQLVVAELALGEPKRPVGPATRREQVARRETRAPEQRDQLLAREAPGEIVPALVGDAPLPEELLSPTAPGSGGVHVDLDCRKLILLPLGHPLLPFAVAHRTFQLDLWPRMSTASECSPC